MLKRQARNSRYPYDTIMYTLSCSLVLIITMTSSTHALKRNIIRSRDFPAHSVDMDGLNTLLDSLDAHLESFRKRTCAVGLQSHNCALSDLSSLMRSKAFLSSGFSPGKRSNGLTLEGQGQDKPAIPRDIMEEAKALQADVVEQRKVIWRLKHLLQSLRQENEPARERHNQKRSCSFRLGGHCLTEELDRAASQYYYLRSPDSPGRRRRSTKTKEPGSDAAKETWPKSGVQPPNSVLPPNFYDNAIEKRDADSNTLRR